jgi:hypothetical protein
MVKQEQVKVLTSEVAKYQHHLMMEKETTQKLFDLIGCYKANTAKNTELMMAQEARIVEFEKKHPVFSPGSPEAKFAAKSPLVTGKNGCPTPFSPAYQEQPCVGEEEGSETDEDVDEDFNYQSQPQPDYDMWE